MTEETLNIQIKASVQQAVDSINKVKKDLKGIDKEGGNSAKGIDKVTKSLNDVKKASNQAKQGVEKAMGGIKKSVQSVLKTVASFALAAASLSEGIEFGKLQGKLNAAFQSAGSSAAQATKTFKELYRFLGDSDRAVETAQNLARITTNEKDLAEWTKILQGVYATMGDAIPIETLAESVNETAQVAKVTGTLADALNWMGVSEDAVNSQLATMNNAHEREVYLRSLLNGLYSNAAAIYEHNSKAMLDYNQSQANLKIQLADVAAKLLPLITAFSNVAAVVLGVLKPAIEIIVQVIATLCQWIITAINWLGAFFGIFSDGKASVSKTNDNINKATTSMKNYGSAIGGAAAAAKELKKQTMGFDELNVVQSPTTTGGGGGGGGGGSVPSIDSMQMPNIQLPDFDDFNAGLDKSRKKVEALLVTLGLIAGAMYAVANWEPITNAIIKATNSVGGLFKSTDRLKALLGSIPAVLSIIAGLYLTITNYNEAWVHGMDASNLIGTLVGVGLAIGGVISLFGGLAGAVAGAIGGIGVLVLSLHDIAENGANATNVIGLIVGVLGTLVSVLSIVSGKFYDLLAAIPKSNIAFAAAAAGVVLLVKTLIDIGENGMNAKNVIMLIVSALLILIPVIYMVNIAMSLNPVLAIVTAVIALIAAIALLVEALRKERDGIKDTQTAMEDLKQAQEDLANATNSYVNAVDSAEAAQNRLAEAEAKTGISGKELFDQVEAGTLDYKDMTDAQREVYKAYLDSEKAQNDLKESTEELRAAKKAETQASIENALALSKEGNSYDDFKATVIDAYNSGRISAEEARDYISRAMANMSQDSRKTFVEDLPSDLQTGLNPSKYESWGTRLKNWFSNLWGDIKGIFRPVAEFFKNIWGKAFNAVKNVFAPIVDFFSNIWGKIKDKFSNLGTSIGDAISSAVKSGVNGIIWLIEGTINTAIGLINGAIRLINLLPGVNVGYVQKLHMPRLAKGGIVDSATIAMVGEQGKEAVVPLENNTEWMDKLADRLAAKIASPTRVSLNVDGKELGWTTINSINSITKQTGNLPLAVI